MNNTETMRASDNYVLNTTCMTIASAEERGAYHLEDDHRGFSRYWIGGIDGDSVTEWACPECERFVDDETEGCEHCGYGRDEDEEEDECWEECLELEDRLDALL